MNDWSQALAIVIVVSLPALALISALDVAPRLNVVETLAVAFGLGLSLFPLLYLWASTVAFRLASRELNALIALSIASAIIGGIVHRGRLRRIYRRTQSGQLLAFALLFALIVYLRFANIQGVVLPLWVDSVHHAAITHLIVTQGALPSSYRPFADVDAVFYHLGYHATVAALSTLLNLDIERTMLIFGQMLNSMACVGVYVLAQYWTKRPRAGLTAMVVVGTLSLMPAYYVTWGRYTQLDGLVILPIAILIIGLALENGSRQLIVLAALVSAGLFLVHYRVSFFLATFVFAYLAVYTWRCMRRQEPFSVIWRRVAAIVFLALLFVLPWLWRLLSTVMLPLETLPSRLAGSSEYNTVPWELITQGDMPVLLALSFLGLLFAILRKQSLALVLVTWLSLTALIVNPAPVGLAPTWVVNNFSLAITLFLPVSIGIAFLATGLFSTLERWVTPHVAGLFGSGYTLAVVLIAMWTGPNMTTIVNPVTDLVTESDVQALQWIRESTPQDAVFLVNERRWQANVYAGTDGGYWIPVLSGRRSTLPIVLYTYGSATYIEQINSLARLIESGPDPDGITFLNELRTRDVGYVYLGARGGPLSLEKFAASAHYHEVYSRNAVHIFTVQY